MKKAIVCACLFACATGVAGATEAAGAAGNGYKGPDYSGTYDCQGDDAHEGKYTGTVTLALVPEQSIAGYGAYRFTLEVPGYGTYRGQAATHGAQMAVHFGLDDPAPKDYGTGIASFSKTKDGRWTFSKFYYEPEFKGGNHGTERCVRR